MRTPNANTAPCQLSTISPFLSAKYQAPISDAQNRLEEAFRRFPAFTEHQTGKYSSTDEEKGIPPPPLRPPIPISWVRQRRGLRKRINNQLVLCIIFAKSCYSAKANLISFQNNITKPRLFKRQFVASRLSQFKVDAYLNVWCVSQPFQRLPCPL